MQRSQNGFSRRRSVCAPNISLFGSPVDRNDVRSFANGHNSYVWSLCENLRATWLSARIVEGYDQTVWIRTLGDRDDCLFVTHIAHDFNIWLFPNRVIEHVAPDPGRVRNQDANLSLFQRIALATHFSKVKTHTQGPPRFNFGPVPMRRFSGPEVLDLDKFPYWLSVLNLIWFWLGVSVCRFRVTGPRAVNPQLGEVCLIPFLDPVERN